MSSAAMIDGSTLQLFGGSVSGEARPLDLMRLIDSTKTSLDYRTRRAVALSNEAERFIEAINKPDFVASFDNEEKVIKTLEKAQDHTIGLVQQFHLMLESAKSDQDLHDHDGVVEAFEEAIEAYSNLNALLEDLRWCVLEHSVDLESHQIQEANISRTPDQISAVLSKLR